MHNNPQATPQTPLSPFSFTINLPNNINSIHTQDQSSIQHNLSAQANPEVNTQVSATAQAQNYTYLKNTIETIQSLAQEYKESTQSYLYSSKYYLAAICLISSYAYLCYQTIRGNLYLKKTNLWSSWKQELS